MQCCRACSCIATIFAILYAVQASVLGVSASHAQDLNHTVIGHRRSWISTLTYEAGDAGKVYVNGREVHSMQRRGGIGRVRLPLQKGDVILIEASYKNGDVGGMAADVMVGNRHFGTGGPGWKGVRAGAEEWRDGCEWGKLTVIGGRAKGFPIRGGARYVWVQRGGRKVWMRYVVGGEECEVGGMSEDADDKCFCKEIDSGGGVCWDVVGGGKKGECEKRECERGYECLQNEKGDGLLCFGKKTNVKVVKREDGSCERMHDGYAVMYVLYGHVE